MNSLRVLITGGSRGIGKRISELYALCHCKVISVDINQEANQKLSESYPNIVTFHADINAKETPETVINYMIEHFNGIDVLVNNVGIALMPATPLHLFPEDAWYQTIETNLNSYYRFSKYAIKQMLTQVGQSNIINIASCQAKQCQTGVPAYCASKGGVLSLTKQMSLEYAPKIRVNAISPATISTPLLDYVCNERNIDQNELKHIYPMDRFGTTNEIAELVLFLTDNSKSGFTTGSNIVIDGGILNEGAWNTGQKHFYEIDKIYE
eukprot:342886_1